DTFTRQLTVLPAPVVSFTGDSLLGCKVPHTVKFTNSTTGATNYQWTLAPGVTSTQQNPTHTYTATGNYTVTLTAVSSAGCSTTLSRNAYVRIAIPTPSIVASPANGGCTGQSLRFTGSVSNPPYPSSS